jgi:hypothetical protein
MAALAAVVLLVAVIGASSYANGLQQQQAAEHATATARAVAALTQVAQTSSPVSTTTTGVTATSTTAGPTATTAPATPPPGTGDKVFSNVAPTCDGASSPSWTKDGVTPTCVGATQVDLAAPQAGTLACLSANAISQDNGYTQVTVDPQSGKAEIGVRQGVGDTTTGSAFNITGYYLAVDPANSAYVVYAVDHAGKTTTLQQGALTAAPPHPFTFGLMFNGTSLTPYVNGQAYPSVTDTKFSNGWTAICTDGSGSFSDVRLYKVAS